MSVDDYSSCVWCFSGVYIDDTRVCDECCGLLCEDCIAEHIGEEPEEIDETNCPYCKKGINSKDINKIIKVLKSHKENVWANKLKNSQLGNL